MISFHEIDLNGIISPLCLLQMKSALYKLRAGELLNVKIHDRELLADIEKIVARSVDEIVEQHEGDSCHRLTIRKG